jgi:hypothetical protein
MSFARRCATVALVMAALAAGCGGGRSEGDTSVAGGDAGGIEVEALKYEVTPDRYQRWVAAQRALDAIPGIPTPPALDPWRVSDAEIDRAVQYLESDPRSRAALARAGVSARDYVLTTIALDQALVVAAQPPVSPGAVTAGSRPRSGAGTASAPRSADRATSGGAASGTASRSTAPSTTPPARTRTRYRNLPRTNQEIVERHRDEINRVRSGMRFRIVKERPDTVVVEAIEPAPTQRVIPAGTTIALRSDARVCASSHKAGDRVTGTVTAAAGSGDAMIPVGSQASLSVVGTPRAGAPMEFTLNSVSINGQSYPVAGSAVASRVDRVRVGSTSKDAQKVVGGAAIGAVAGQVLGKNTKSTVIGAAVGAAAGAAAARASAREDMCVPAGAPIQVTLRDPLPLRV